MFYNGTEVTSEDWFGQECDDFVQERTVFYWEYPEYTNEQP